MTTRTTYREQREEMSQAMAAEVPAGLLDGFAAEAGRLDGIDFLARAPQVGEPAPEFALPDQLGEEVRLSGLLGDGPVVLLFYRGEWCPYCNLQLRTFQAHLDEFTRKGAQLVAISPQTPDNSLSMAEKHELGFPVLSDVGAQVIRRYGLAYEVDGQFRELLQTTGIDLDAYNGSAGWVLPAVGTFVIATDGTVRYAHVRGSWTERTEPVEILDLLDRE